MTEESKKKRRSFKAFTTRLALVAVGLLLGFAARWISHWTSEPVDEKNFIPLEQVQEELLASDDASREVAPFTDKDSN